MVRQTTTVINKTGLHARPASVFVRQASGFESRITVKRVGAGRAADAKSILLLLSLGLSQGTEIEIEADGGDEREAVQTLVGLIESGFGE